MRWHVLCSLTTQSSSRAKLRSPTVCRLGPPNSHYVTSRPPTPPHLQHLHPAGQVHPRDRDGLQPCSRRGMDQAGLPASSTHSSTSSSSNRNTRPGRWLCWHTWLGRAAGHRHRSHTGPAWSGAPQHTLSHNTWVVPRAVCLPATPLVRELGSVCVRCCCCC